MNGNEPKFDAAESLMLIRSMIETTKYSIRDSSHYFLLWGWAVMIGCIAQFTLLSIFKYPNHYLAWLITPVALVVHFIFIFKDRKQSRTKTFIGDANNYLWVAVGSSFAVLAFIFAKIGWQYCFPFYILIYGIGTSVSGALLQFRPMVIGGATCFILAAVAAYLPYNLQILLTAFAILISYIIPGHLLRNHYNKTRLHTLPVVL